MKVKKQYGIDWSDEVENVTCNRCRLLLGVGVVDYRLRKSIRAISSR